MGENGVIEGKGLDKMIFCIVVGLLGVDFCSKLVCWNDFIWCVKEDVGVIVFIMSCMIGMVDVGICCMRDMVVNNLFNVFDI